MDGPIDHPFKVVLGFGTKLQKDDSLKDIPFHEFCFKDFKKIQPEKFKTDVLYGEVILFGIFTAPFIIFMIIV